jgi:hypothetical protein
MRRLRPADAVAGAAGLALLVSLFLPWYELGAPQVHTAGSRGATPVVNALGDVSPTAWQAFTVVDVLLALAALLAIALPVVTVVASGPAKPVTFTVLTTLAGLLATLLAAWRLIDSPAGGLTPRYGAWIGLAAALAVFLGGSWSMKDERSPGVALPQIPRRPAP